MDNYIHRQNGDGTNICLYENYTFGGCNNNGDGKNEGMKCDDDHEHCHTCLQKGHKSLKCEETLSVV
mgnify:CR=1 FL=1